MLLLNHTGFTLVEDTYDIKLDNGRKIQYKEWCDSKGNVLETRIKDSRGKEISDEGLLLKIWGMLGQKARKRA